SENNAMLHLFSYQEDLLRYGGRHYRPYSEQTSTFLHQLFAQYAQEGFLMSFTYEQGIRDARKEIVKSMSPEERKEIVKTLPAEELLECVPVEKRLEGLSDEQIRAALPPQMREALLRGSGSETAPSDESATKDDSKGP